MSGAAQPYPPIPRAARKASSLTLGTFMDVLGLDSANADDRTTATRLRAAANAHVEKYAPDAPEDVKHEALLRFGGYLATTFDTLGIKKLNTGTDVEMMHLHGPAFRNSGAAMLLTPWKVRRAGTF